MVGSITHVNHLKERREVPRLTEDLGTGIPRFKMPPSVSIKRSLLARVPAVTILRPGAPGMARAKTFGQLAQMGATDLRILVIV
jgi:hypothetical protein